MGDTVWSLLENTISYKDEALSEEGPDIIFLGQWEGQDN